METEFRTIETVDMDLDTTIAALFIDIPEEVRVPSKAIEVKFTGFKNPNYVDQSNLSGELQVQILGESIDRW